MTQIGEPPRPYESYKAFTVIFPDSMPEVAAMVDWKLRGEKIGRCIGTMSVCLTNFMHGAGVMDAKKELYIGVGLIQEEQRVFEQLFEHVPKQKKHIIGLPEGFGPLGYMMVGYTLVGKIQSNYPAFQERVNKYSLLPRIGNERC